MSAYKDHNQLVMPDQSAASAEGMALLSTNDALGKTALSFCEYPEFAHMLVEGDNYINSGRFSDVCEVGGIALKLSTPMTGNLSRNTEQPTFVEDLIDQYGFMTDLHKWLRERPDSDISVPEQYFAIQKGDSYLLAMQHMKGMEPLHLWVRRRWTDELDKISASFAIGSRIINVLKGSNLWYGMTDTSSIGAAEDISIQLDSTNILVSAKDGDPETARIGIIDQNPPPSDFRDILHLLPTLRDGQNDLAPIFRQLQVQS